MGCRPAPTSLPEAGSLRPVGYAEFAISAGPLPTPGELVLPAKQTYSDGEVADWSDVVEEDGEEPEHPAPSSEVTAAEEGGHHATTEDDLSEDEGSQTASADTLARVLGGLALVVALVGAGVAVAGRRRA
ncbi:DUF1775 domain-containing protein [Janibacter indicus]|uniref:DUF1775 domain-containing protein n=1 Tax=Janibacter indicus TaxID=857417 RepID=A0A7L9J2M8_9MICO|nr:DUF1775 domain-containing protein [Janibacter indicus]QOK23265.1 DUF1775 domain-containing protein [Janibacter indicus]